MYARLYQARCMAKTGKHKEAMGIITADLLSQPEDQPAFRTLRIKTLIEALNSWQALGQHAEGVSKGLAFLDTVRPQEERSPDVAELRYKTAVAIDAYVTELKKKNPADKDARKLMGDGKKLIASVLKFPNDWQDDARKLQPKFATAGGAETASARAEPKTFAEAKQMGQEAIQEMQDANATIKAIEGRLASAAAAEKAEMQKELEKSKKTADGAKENAAFYFTAAQKYIQKDTPLDDVNVIRYLLCYLKFLDGQYMDAIVLGEFVAKRYPVAAGARPCAKICLASYLKLYSDPKNTDKTFESERIVELADYIVKKWPNEPEAEEALNTLIPFMIKNGELDRAQAYLDKISKDSPHRGSAELKTGQALWGNYLKGSRELRQWDNGELQPPAGTDVAKVGKDLEQMKVRAQKTLEDGVARMKQGAEITPTVATAALSLAQIYADINQPAKAVALLEDKKIGPLTLLAAKSEAMAKPGLSEETYKTALRAYISSLSAGAKVDSDAMVAKAQGIMQELKASVGSTPEGQKKLVATYVGLARDLQTQMENSSPEVKVGLGKGFEAFLDQVGKDATELNILNWVGETYRGMGESFVVKGVLAPEGKYYYDKAMAMFQKILDKGKADPKFITPDMATQLRLQMAKTYRLSGEYKQAADLFETILKDKRMLLPVQVEAAHTYQEWGARMARGSDADSKKAAADRYRDAIIGARPDKTNPDKIAQQKNIIWGWGEIAKLTANNPKFEDQFHEARYNLALCRFRRAEYVGDAAKQKAEYMQVKTDIAVTRGLYPELGGPKWQAQYEKLMIDAQTKLKEKPIGLKALEQQAADSGTAAKPAG
jgi:hypothetical protein